MPLPRQQQVLFSPGPVNVHPDIKANLFNVELCHRQPEFADLKDRVERRLFAVVGFTPESHALSLLPGAGTLAVDAALSTFVRGEVLVLNNGVYAKRLLNTLRMLGASCEELSVPAGTPIQIEAVEAALQRSSPEWIAIVHHETSTGMLNPLSEVADLAVASGCRLFVDAVSSVGAHGVDPRADVVCFNSSKCLESLPGIAGVFFRRDLRGYPTTSALDAIRYCEGIPTTPNVHAYMALDIALDLLLSEDRPARYRRLAHRVWTSGGRVFEPYLPEVDRSHVLTAFRLNGRSPEALLQRALENGYVIYAGQGALRQEIFRVANMGAAIDEQRIDDLFKVLDP
jgi:2-aminoethylphosphonate-pyruvate transaminase